jgi:ABC-type sulfate/molybdate transport systems ATPase subunit
MSISLRGVSKQFGEFAAVDDVSLEIPTGALLALLGPSGCGKTTLLRIIAGLETPEHGQVLFDGQDATLWPIRDRKVGFVFQNYALFRHMTVFENIAFGLKVKSRRERPSGADIRKKVQSLLELVQLAGREIDIPRSFPAARNSAWRWRGRWPSIRRCCCWTSLSVPWMPRCAMNCGAGCGACIPN